tara:strand:- start:3055 stop:3528 length:474 start_codon:yes stop_codon:yes gene_type:complete
MKYYFVFNTDADGLLSEVLYSAPTSLNDQRFMEWDTEVHPRTLTIESLEEGVDDVVIDRFEHAIPNFGKYDGIEPGPKSFFLDTGDEEALEEAKNNQMDLFRLARNKKLSDSDWTQSPDSPLTDEKKTEWATYRGLLRNLPPSVTNPWIIDWPTQPS